jgi:hypothetical protein
MPSQRPGSFPLLTCYELQRSRNSSGAGVNHVRDTAGRRGGDGYQEAEGTSHTNEHGAGLPPGARDVPEPAMHEHISIC